MRVHDVQLLEQQDVEDDLRAGVEDDAKPDPPATCRRAEGRADAEEDNRRDEDEDKAGKTKGVSTRELERQSSMSQKSGKDKDLRSAEERHNKQLHERHPSY